jgi:hypothetical protein
MNNNFARLMTCHDVAQYLLLLRLREANTAPVPFDQVDAVSPPRGTEQYQILAGYYSINPAYVYAITGTGVNGAWLIADGYDMFDGTRDGWIIWRKRDND